MTFNEDLYSDGIPKIRDIDKPLVMIVGTGANTGKFDIQLRVREMFLSGGYKVSQIGSKSYCELWGFHSFPDFMNKTLNAAEKIVRFNHYVNYIANSEDADIVIVGVPGGVVPISNKLFDDFGIMNYMVANAVKPDYVILNTGFVDYNNNYVETMVKALKYRLDYDVDSVFLSNFYINWEATDSLDRLVYMTLPVNVVDEEARICGCYSLYNKESVEACKENLFSTLIGYGDLMQYKEQIMVDEIRRIMSEITGRDFSNINENISLFSSAIGTKARDILCLFLEIEKDMV